MTIHVYHPYRQPDGINHCQAVNGHCSHFCLPAPRFNDHGPKISCVCPNGLKLMKDGLMCTEDSKCYSLFVLGLRTNSKFILNKSKIFSAELRQVNKLNETIPDGKKIHPEENDSGTVALIAIFAASAILIILSVVS